MDFFNCRQRAFLLPVLSVWILFSVQIANSQNRRIDDFFLEKGGLSTLEYSNDAFTDTVQNVCPVVHPQPPTECGNEVLERGEGCDDGNTVSGDGCAEDCTGEVCCLCQYQQIEDCFELNREGVDWSNPANVCEGCSYSSPPTNLIEACESLQVEPYGYRECGWDPIQQRCEGRFERACDENAWVPSGGFDLNQCDVIFRSDEIYPPSIHPIQHCSKVVHFDDSHNTPGSCNSLTDDFMDICYNCTSINCTLLTSGCGSLAPGQSLDSFVHTVQALLFEGEEVTVVGNQATCSTHRPSELVIHITNNSITYEFPFCSDLGSSAPDGRRECWENWEEAICVESEGGDLATAQCCGGHWAYAQPGASRPCSESLLAFDGVCTGIAYHATDGSSWTEAYDEADEEVQECRNRVEKLCKEITGPDNIIFDKTETSWWKVRRERLEWSCHNPITRRPTNSATSGECIGEAPTNQEDHLAQIENQLEECLDKAQQGCNCPVEYAVQLPEEFGRYLIQKGYYCYNFSIDSASDPQWIQSE